MEEDRKMMLYYPLKSRSGMDCVDVRSGDSVAVRPGATFVINAGGNGYVIHCAMMASGNGNSNTHNGNLEGKK